MPDRRDAPNPFPGIPDLSHDTLLHRLVRPAARQLAPTRLRPNHLTALRIATALAAAAAFARGTPAAIWAGSGLFTVSAVLDRADGELARLTGRFSGLGHKLDLISEFIHDLALLSSLEDIVMPVEGIGGQVVGEARDDMQLD